MSKLVNFVGFQACWFACVLGAAHGAAWLGPPVVAAWLVYAARSAGAGARETLALLAVGCLGALVGALELAAGWLEFRGGELALGALPLWIPALWIAFATTFESSFAWVTRRTGLLVAFAALGSPLSYLGGERLGALTVLAPRPGALVGVGVLWAIALPVASALYRRVRGPRG